MQTEQQVAINRAILALDEKHPNAIPIFGGAYFVRDLDGLIASLPHVVSSAKTLKWHESIADTLRTFCRLCYVDPMLVEAYIGIRFEKLEEQLCRN